MTSPSKGTALGAAPISQPEFKEYVVLRDNERPFSFVGAQLARASRESGMFVNFEALEAAIYKTRAGKFITSLTKTKENLVKGIFGTDGDEVGQASGYHKAALHDTFEEAVAWFRPGRLTDEIRRQLGLDEAIHIE